MILSHKSLQVLVVSLVASIVLAGEFPALVHAQDSVSTDIKVEQPEYVYSPIGRRDPFAPLVQKIKKMSTKPEKEKGPLEKFELSQFRLMALLIIQGTPRAMVKAPDGKSYTVKPGDLIGSNGGIVKRIETKTVVIDESSGQRIEKSPDRVVVEEIGADSYTGKEFKEFRYIEM